MRILILILSIMSVGYSQTPSIEPGVSHELAKWRAERYSDVRYKLDLTIEKMSPVLKGTMEVRVSLRDAVGGGSGDAAIVLDWRKIKGFEERSNVSNVSINGAAATPSGIVRVTPSGVNSAAESSTQITPKGVTLTNLTFEESNEHLIFRDGVVAGENVIKLDFTSPILPSGSAITRYIDKEDGSEYIYSLFVPSDASTAFPVFDQPDLKARFTLTINLKNLTARNVVTNTHKLGEAFGPNGHRGIAFAETLPISTYVFSFAIGNFIELFEPGSGGEQLGSRTFYSDSSSTRYEPRKGDRRIYVRESQAEKFRPHSAEVFRLNRDAVKYFEEYYDYKFPFPKYDLVLIPEFPFGGMEHAGATFLREASIIFPQEPTKNDIANRATLIFHEAAHQWFGDTVTMRWFDDLWLKEGFATFTAYKAMEKIMPEMNSWKVFYERIKQGAYQTDSTKGTTAIYQPIANLSAAKSAYGNIVYNKAPAFLRQAEFYLGEDKFRTAVRSFLKKHEFGNASWEDLVREFQGASGKDLKQWAEQWVTQRGLPLYRITVTPSGPSSSQTEIRSTSSSDVTNFWKQRINVIRDDGPNPRTTFGIELEPRFPSDSIKLDYSVSHGTIRSELFFPNYQDYGYGVFLLDHKSISYIRKNIQDETDPLLRSMMWGALWDSVREGELDPREYVELVLRVQSTVSTRQERSERSTGITPEGVTLTITDDESTTAMILNRVSTAMTYYIADKQRDDLAPRLEALLIDKMRTAPTLGQRITYYRALLNTVSTEKGRGALKELLRQQSVPPAVASGSDAATKNPPATAGGTDSCRRVGADNALPLKTKDYFDIVTKLASLNDPEAEKLLADLEKTETSDDAKRYAYAARAAFPTKETKEKYWNDFTTNKQISESWIEAAFGPFNSVRHADLTLPYLERALKELPNHKRNRKIFFVNGWLGAFVGGQKSEEALAIVNKFLADNPNLDRDLRLKILENVDVVERAVKIRKTYSRVKPS